VLQDFFYLTHAKAGIDFERIHQHLGMRLIHL
jgi:hypothetical protein